MIIGHHTRSYAIKLNNLEKIDTFLELDHISRLSQREVKNQSKLRSSGEINTTTRNFPQNKSPRPDGFK